MSFIPTPDPLLSLHLIYHHHNQPELIPIPSLEGRLTDCRRFRPRKKPRKSEISQSSSFFDTCTRFHQLLHRAMPFLLLSLGNSQSLLSARRPASQPASGAVQSAPVSGLVFTRRVLRPPSVELRWRSVLAVVPGLVRATVCTLDELSSREMNSLPRAMSNFLVSPSSYSFRAGCGLILFLISNKKKENSSFGVLRETTVQSHTRTLLSCPMFSECNET